MLHLPPAVETAAELLEARRKAKLSQQELAGMLAISRNTVHRWETGDPIPRDRAIALGLFFHVVNLAANPAKPKPVGRPAALIPNGIYSEYRTQAGETISYLQAKALPAGTVLRCMSAIGRIPSEAHGDTWRNIIRTDHPSQPFRVV